jgi:L-alanine-DL-glutamate epimerase-like enolase superfamily enzyme
MRIESVTTLHADGGRRAFDFVKVVTDDGLVGWSEYNETFGGAGLTALIEHLAPALIGKDPRAHEAHVALMQALRRTAAGGVVQQAIGAIENALLDVKARTLGIPVYELLGGPVRDSIRVYWSHCTAAPTGWAGGASSGSRRSAPWTTWRASGVKSWPAATLRSRRTSCCWTTTHAFTTPGSRAVEGSPS